MGQSPGPGRTYNQLAGTSVERLSGISDGTFSVGMTLLVLGLAVPALSTGAATEGQLWSALATLGPNVLVYVMSFMTLGIFWVGQGTQLGRLARSNRHYVWIQLTFLLTVTLVPFSTALLAHFPTFEGGSGRVLAEHRPAGRDAPGGRRIRASGASV